MGPLGWRPKVSTATEPYCYPVATSSYPVRVGLIGYGLAGATFHAPLIEATEGLELTAVVTSDSERQRRAQADHTGVVLVDTATELMAAATDLALELVVVATPNRAHVPQALAALAAGLAVVVDKPLAVSASDGRRVAAAAEERGLLLSVFHNRRWDGDFLTVQRLVGTAALGQVLRFESRYERWRPEVRSGVWRERADPAEGGGLLLDLQSHLVDQALVLFGSPTSVYAEIAQRRAGAGTEDDTFLALEHPGGVISHLWASSVAPRPGPRFRVLGDRAGYAVFGMDVQEAALGAGELPEGASWGQAPADRWGSVGAGDDIQPVPTERGDYRRYYQGIVASLRQGASPPVAPEEAIRTLTVLDAARASAAQGQVVALGPE